MVIGEFQGLPVERGERKIGGWLVQQFGATCACGIVSGLLDPKNQHHRNDDGDNNQYDRITFHKTPL